MTWETLSSEQWIIRPQQAACDKTRSELPQLQRGYRALGEEAGSQIEKTYWSEPEVVKRITGKSELCVDCSRARDLSILVFLQPVSPNCSLHLSADLFLLNSPKYLLHVSGIAQRINLRTSRFTNKIIQGRIGSHSPCQHK